MDRHYDIEIFTVSANDNGILASIPGEYVSKATSGFPEAVTVPWKTVRESELEVPGIGRVRFTAEAMNFKHGRSTHYYWSVKRAVLVDG